MALTSCFRLAPMSQGRIVESGGPELAHRLEKEGYAAFGADQGKEAA